MGTYGVLEIQKAGETGATVANIQFTGFIQHLNLYFINFTPPYIFYEKVLALGHQYAGKREMVQMDTGGSEHENQISFRNALQHQWDHMSTRNYKFYVQFSDQVLPKVPENGVEEWKKAVKIKEQGHKEGGRATRRR